MRTNKHLILFYSVIIFVIVSSNHWTAVTAQSSSGSGLLYDLPLCLPGLYQVDPQDCLPFGPSQSIRMLEKAGLPYPISELPAIVPDSGLSELPVMVAKIMASSSNAVPVYADLDSARAGGPAVRTLAAGPMRYVSMVNQVNVNGRTIVQLESGEWMEATPIYSWTRFQGLQFSETPDNDFGWIVDDTESYNAPGYGSLKTGKYYKKYESIQIFRVEEADGYFWYLVGPDEWVSSHRARRMVVDTIQPEGVEGNRWINIDLFNHTLSVYEDGELRFASLIASGLKPFYTQPGVFQIYRADKTVTMQDAYEADRSDFYHLQAVPWAMFYDRNTAIHGVYWPVVLGFPQSHGCVNMSVGDAHWVFNWAKIGDWVYVHDPSGATPTDPALYGGTVGP